jgi:hypothetical protein
MNLNTISLSFVWNAKKPTKRYNSNTPNSGDIFGAKFESANLRVLNT